MSRAEAIRKRAEKNRIIVTCSSGNEYLIGKASLRDMALIGELAIPDKLVGEVVKPPTLEDQVPPEVRAKAEEMKPAWVREPRLATEIRRAVGQVLGVMDFLRRYVYDPQIVPDSEPITDPESQVHESDITEDMQELVSYISDYSGGAEVADLKPFPGRPIGSGPGPSIEAIRAEAMPDDGAQDESLREPALRPNGDEAGGNGGE